MSYPTTSSGHPCGCAQPSDRITITPRASAVQPVRNTLEEGHSPAPWQVAVNRNLPHEPIEVLARGGNMCVASHLGDGPEAAANARLIAAAPEMLEALEFVKTQFQSFRTGHGAARYHTLNMVDDAISKAKGQK